jgi:hypothetical protein
MPGSLLKVRYSSSSASHSASISHTMDAGASSSALSKSDLILALDIDPLLCDDNNSDKGLILAYAKWKAIQDAYKRLQAMVWHGTKPNYGSIISLFVSSSMFYSHYKHFNDAVKYPAMVEWLEEREDRPSDMDLWGKEKSHYTFSDLTKWLKEAGDGAGAAVDSSDNGRRKSKKSVGKKKEKSSSEKKSHKSKKSSKKL